MATRVPKVSRGTVAAPHGAFMEDAMAAQHDAHYTPLGTIESNAPAAALLAVLQTLRPQWNIRLVPADSEIEPRYRVEMECSGVSVEGTHIATWLHIKSALMASFPADKPNAVRAIDP
jgi:hypothetical protein